MYIYQKSCDMEFIEIGENELTVFDPETGDTHILDETGSIICGLLEEAITLPELLNRLCGIYSAAAAEMEGDVTEFLDQLYEKGIIRRTEAEK